MHGGLNVLRDKVVFCFPKGGDSYMRKYSPPTGRKVLSVQYKLAEVVGGCTGKNMTRQEINAVVASEMAGGYFGGTTPRVLTAESTMNRISKQLDGRVIPMQRRVGGVARTRAVVPVYGDEYA